MTTDDQTNLRIRVSTQELCTVLRRIQGLNEELLDSLSEQEEALVEVKVERLDELRDQEERLLRRIIEEEKERLLVVEEIGDLLGHQEPSTLCVSELLPHLPEDLAVDLSNRRERLRTVATQLSRQNSLNRALIEHSVGHIQIFMSRIAAETNGFSYGPDGGESDAEGDSFLMDRRA